MTPPAYAWIVLCSLFVVVVVVLMLEQRDSHRTIARLRQGINNANRRTEDAQRLLSEERALRAKTEWAWMARSVRSTADVMVEHDIVTLYVN